MKHFTATHTFYAGVKKRGALEIGGQLQSMLSAPTQTQEPITHHCSHRQPHQRGVWAGHSKPQPDDGLGRKPLDCNLNHPSFKI